MRFFVISLLSATIGHGDARALEIFPKLKEKYKDDANALAAAEAYESQLREAGKVN
jgi:hypothetical protein